MLQHKILPVLALFVASYFSLAPVSGTLTPLNGHPTKKVGVQALQEDVDVFASVTKTKVFYGNSSQEALLTFVETLEFCQRHGLEPITVESQHEHDIIFTYLNTTFATYPQVWLGASDFGKEGNFYWLTSGQAFAATYSNWQVNNPNGGLAENCAYLCGETDRWYDYYCDYNLFRPICQGYVFE